MLDSVIQYTEGRNIPGLLLFIDFEKAFDTLEWPFISKTLQHFGFEPSLLNWIKLFYCNIESCILNNGWASNILNSVEELSKAVLCRHIYLFYLQKYLLTPFGKKQRIKGIEINGIDLKLSQYADDTTLILDGSEESFLESVILIETFGDISGLRLNIKKTEALWIGSKKDCDLKLLPEKDFKWPKKKVKGLGVWLSTDPNIITSLNYNEKIEKIRSILECWKFRRLTLLGKIAVLKSLVASQLVYIFSPLQANHEAIKEINTIFYKFLWNDKGDKIKRKIMINDYSEGGLKMIDIASFNKSLKAKWIQKYLGPESSSKWK